MTRPTSALLGFSAAAAALSLTFVNSTGVASAATPTPRTAPDAALPAFVAPAQVAHPGAAILDAAVHPTTRHRANFVQPVRQHRAAHARHRTRRTYTVKPGQSFWSIAKAEHVDWYNLAADNGLTMYAVLDAGQVLVLPDRGEKAHAAMPLEATGAGSTTTVTSARTASIDHSASESPSAATTGSSSFEQCVISRESGGDADITNGAGYWGLFQFSASTWAAYGGSSADFGSASAGEQEQVFQRAVSNGGASNWAPFDGC